MSRMKVAVPNEAQHIFKTTVPVLVSHINYGNHLGNDSLVSILHEARLQYVKNKGMKSETNIEGNTGLMVCSLAVTYYNEAFHGDHLDIDVYVSDITKIMCDFTYKVTRNTNGAEQVIAIATTCLLFFDFSNKKSVQIPKSFLSAISNEKIMNSVE